MKTSNIKFLLLYFLAFLIIISYRKDEIIIFSVLLATIIIALSQYNVRMIPVILLTVLFTIVENISVHYGLWKYNTKNPMPYVPVWLYLAWMASIIFIIKLYDDRE